MSYASAAVELSLHIDNTYALHKMDVAIMANLALKMAKGTYNRDLAVKGYMHLTERAAKDYAEEHGGVWNRLFSVEDRKAVAVLCRNYFESECAAGACAHMLPAKYRKSAPAKRKKKK